MDIASRNIEEVTTARWFVMRGYKMKKSGGKTQRQRRIGIFRNFIETAFNGVATEDILIDAGVRLLSE